MAETGDPVEAALHADAQAARSEIRAASVVCPSCDANMADLPADHLLPYTTLNANPPIAQCNYGQSVPLGEAAGMSDADFKTWQAAANIALYDDFRKREAEAFAKMLGGEA